MEHNNLQLKSPGKVYDTSEYMTSLCNLTIKEHAGTRVSFVSNWFEELMLLNKYSPPGTGMQYDFAKNLLLRALNGDDKLPDAFTELNNINNQAIDLAAMKRHLALFNLMNSSPVNSLRMLSKPKTSLIHQMILSNFGCLMVIIPTSKLLLDACMLLEK